MDAWHLTNRAEPAWQLPSWLAEPQHATRLSSQRITGSAAEHLWGGRLVLAGEHQLRQAGKMATSCPILGSPPECLLAAPYQKGGVVPWSAIRVVCVYLALWARLSHLTLCSTHRNVAAQTCSADKLASAHSQIHNLQGSHIDTVTWIFQQTQKAGSS